MQTSGIKIFVFVAKKSQLAVEKVLLRKKRFTHSQKNDNKGFPNSQDTNRLHKLFEQNRNT